RGGGAGGTLAIAWAEARRGPAPCQTISCNIFQYLSSFCHVMQAEERQKRIEEHLFRMEFASLEELSELEDASVATVRRDLGVLEGKGTVQRTHGGAKLLNPRSDEFAFHARDTHQLEEKEAIGRSCADL